MKRYSLARNTLVFLGSVFAFVLMDFRRATSYGRAEERGSNETIAKLIEDLGSDLFDKREAATRTLKERVEALPALRKAQQSDDKEVRRRVQDILAALKRKRALDSLSKTRSFGKGGRAVEIADRLAFAAKCGVAGDEGWESLMQFADKVTKRTERYYPPGLGLRHRNRSHPG